MSGRGEESAVIGPRTYLIGQALTCPALATLATEGRYTMEQMAQWAVTMADTCLDGMGNYRSELGP